MSIFPTITAEIQEQFEQNGQAKVVPLICGFMGRACRQMGKEEGANRANCTGCSLARFAKNMEEKK